MTSSKDRNAIVIVAPFFIAIIVAILFSATYLFGGNTPSKYLVGSVNNPDYVRHGEAVKRDSVKCYNDKVVTATTLYNYWHGNLYSIDLPDDMKRDTMYKIKVKSSINPDNKDEIITSITSYGPDKEDIKDLKVPLSVGCASEVKEITTFSTQNVPEIKRVEVAGLCAHGAPSFKRNNIFRADGISYYNPVVSLDHSGKYFIITTSLEYDYSASDKGPKEYILPDTVPIEISCDYNPEL